MKYEEKARPVKCHNVFTVFFIATTKPSLWNAVVLCLFYCSNILHPFFLFFLLSSLIPPSLPPRSRPRSHLNRPLLTCPVTSSPPRLFASAEIHKNVISPLEGDAKEHVLHQKHTDLKQKMRDLNQGFERLRKLSHEGFTEDSGERERKYTHTLCASQSHSVFISSA